MKMREFNISREGDGDPREEFHLATLIECTTKIIEQDIESVYLVVRLNPGTKSVGGGLLGCPECILDSIEQIVPAVEDMVRNTLRSMIKTIIAESD